MGVVGGASAGAVNQQFVVDEAERQAATQSAMMAELDPAVLAALSEKQQRALDRFAQTQVDVAARWGDYVRSVG